MNKKFLRSVTILSSIILLGGNALAEDGKFTKNDMQHFKQQATTMKGETFVSVYSPTEDGMISAGAYRTGDNTGEGYSSKMNYHTGNSVHRDSSITNNGDGTVTVSGNRRVVEDGKDVSNEDYHKTVKMHDVKSNVKHRQAKKATKAM